MNWPAVAELSAFAAFVFGSPILAIRALRKDLRK